MEARGWKRCKVVVPESRKVNYWRIVAGLFGM